MPGVRLLQQIPAIMYIGEHDHLNNHQGQKKSCLSCGRRTEQSLGVHTGIASSGPD